MSNAIQDRAMLLHLSIGMWSPSVDEAAAVAVVEKAIEERELEANGGEINEKRKLNRKSGKFRKWLIDTDDKAWQRICEPATKCRQAIRKITLKWLFDGGRILPVCYVNEAGPIVEPFKVQFWDAVEQCWLEMNRMKFERQAAIGDLYREEDYPQTREDFIKAFRFKLDIVPLPPDSLSEGLMSQLSEEQRRECENAVDGGQRSMRERAIEEMLTEVAEVTQRMAERLANPDATFRDSLVTNVRRLVTKLDNMNVIGSAEVEELRQHLARALANREPQELRDTPALRAETAQVAAEISDLAVRKIRRLSTLASASPSPAPPEVEDEAAAMLRAAEETLGIPIVFAEGDPEEDPEERIPLSQARDLGVNLTIH